MRLFIYYSFSFNSLGPSDFSQISRRLGEIWHTIPEKEKMVIYFVTVAALNCIMRSKRRES